MPPEIGRLQYLRVLTLSGNSLYGTLPSELGHLKKLSTLSLSANKFTGSLPSEMGNLKELSELELTKNEFTGTLQAELCILSKWPNSISQQIIQSFDRQPSFRAWSFDFIYASLCQYK